VYILCPPGLEAQFDVKCAAGIGVATGSTEATCFQRNDENPVALNQKMGDMEIDGKKSLDTHAKSA
jgi:hypothetical protein